MKNFIFWLLCLLTSISAEASHKVMFPHLCPRGQRIEKTLFPLSRIRQSTDVAKDIYERERKIVFLSDWRQLNQRDAVLWSCANEKNDTITDWYMAAFGLLNDHAMCLGFSEENKPCPIISFFPNSDSEFKMAFCKNFRKIASTSVGRVLLYRLLLEIRRVDQYGNGVLDSQFGRGDVDQSRNILRRMYICMHTSNGFDFDQGVIGFHDYKDSFKTSVVNSDGTITMEPRTDDVGLFHELLHWFHGLCNINSLREAYTPEGCASMESSSPNLSTGRELMKLWLSKNKQGVAVFSADEFRTVMGFDCLLNPGKINLEGDLYGLSENLYRLCVGQKLRYGHNELIDGKTYDFPSTGILTGYYDNIFEKGGYQKYSDCILRSAWYGIKNRIRGFYENFRNIMPGFSDD